VAAAVEVAERDEAPVALHRSDLLFWRMTYDKVNPEIEMAAGALVATGWINEGFASDAQSARYRDWARGLVELYAAGLDPADEPVGVERTVATRTDVIAVSGRIDRLDSRPRADGADGTELVIVDYKTGRRVLSVDDARSSLALALYAIAAARTLHRDCRQVELHHLPSGQVLAWTHTGESLARHLRRAEEVAQECAAADERMRAPLPAANYDEVFPPKPSPVCGWCDYQRFCPEGQQAAAPHRPWDALAELLRAQLGALGGVPERGEGVRGGGRGLHVRVMRGGRDAGAFRVQPGGHVLLERGGPGVVVLAVEDVRRDGPGGQLARPVVGLEQVGAHGDQAGRVIAEHPLLEERQDRRGQAGRHRLRLERGVPHLRDLVLEVRVWRAFDVVQEET
jgi:RecB family exonuclease